VVQDPHFCHSNVELVPVLSGKSDVGAGPSNFWYKDPAITGNQGWLKIHCYYWYRFHLLLVPVPRQKMLLWQCRKAFVSFLRDLVCCLETLFRSSTVETLFWSVLFCSCSLGSNLCLLHLHLFWSVAIFHFSRRRNGQIFLQSVTLYIKKYNLILL
jgi:hypothetical protein